MMPSAPVPGEKTIATVFAEQAAQTPDAIFAIFPHVSLTYAEVDTAARAVAKGLIALGVQPGMHVATLMPNCPDWLPAYYGALYAGAAVAALNARYKRQELGYTLPHCDASVLLTTDAIADHVDHAALIAETLPDIAAQSDPAYLHLAAAPRLRAVVLAGRSKREGFLKFDRLIALGAAVPDEAVDAARAAVHPDDVAALLYTSGTTANPKACALTHAGIQRSWYTFAEIVDLAGGEKLWMPMPFFHTGGIGPMAAIASRGAAFMTQAHFEPAHVVALVERHRIEHLYSGFPQFSLTVLQHPTYSKERFGFIRSMLNVGPPAMQHSIQDALPPGAALLNLFGMTEGSGIVTFTPFDAPIEIRATTSGRPPAHTQVRIIDPESNSPCPPDQPGEIQFRGGGALKHYYRDSEATRETILEGGWVRTGDRGKMDADGWLYYLGRLKDMLKVGGENVAAAEIEFFLTRHPEVKMVQVIGAPDARMGEVPVAFVERVPGTDVSARALIEMCEGELARWKIPREVIFVTEWPMSSTKVQKFKLRDGLPERYRELA